MDTTVIQTPTGKKVSDAEKLAQAVKKAKAERARKAVNHSFDRSIRSIRRRKQKKEASNTQAYYLKQAAALQQKNEAIVTAAIKAKQYNRQLGIVNYHFDEQQRVFCAKIASDKRKIKTIQKENEQLSRESSEIDKMLIVLRNHFGNAASAIDSVKSENSNCEDMESSSENISVASDQSFQSEISFDETSSENELTNNSKSDSEAETENVTNHETVYMELTAPNASSDSIKILKDVSNSSSNSFRNKNSEKKDIPSQQSEKTSKDSTSLNAFKTSQNISITQTDISQLSIDNNHDFNLESDKLSSSPKLLRTSTGSENEETIRRSSRRSATEKVTSYAEPKLGSKLRRGDKIADDSLFKSFTPKKKRKSKKLNKMS